MVLDALLLVLVAVAVLIEGGFALKVPSFNEYQQQSLTPLPSSLRFQAFEEVLAREKQCGPNNITCVKGYCMHDKCDCDPGFSGDACDKELECGGHGSFDKDKDTCSCDKKWFGARCTYGPCPADCNGNGLCFHDSKTHRARCVCQNGFSGTACDNGGCPKDCSGHGQCLEMSGGEGDSIVRLCQCNLGWSGQDCSQKVCPVCLNGACEDGKCVCSPGWGGLVCDKRVCLNNCTSADHGECVDGVCVCNEKEYFGQDCSVPIALCPHKCSGHGKCTAKGCICEEEWGDADCSKTCPDHCSIHGVCSQGTCICFSGYNGDNCGNLRCKDDCNNNGLCVNATCHCHYPFAGEFCEIKQCPQMCSNRGKCNNGTCSCDVPPFPEELRAKSWPLGYTLDDCSGLRCPNNCTGPLLGTCDFTTGKCTCKGDYMGDDCSKESCNDTCSNNGHCPDKATGCLCYAGWRGRHCEESYCPKNCSAVEGQGKCSNETCVCNKGFFGPDCSQKQCPTALSPTSELIYEPLKRPQGRPAPPGVDHYLDPLACTRQGDCVGGQCACWPGWHGLACHIRKCPNDCSGNGVCIQGSCECKAGWTGVDCHVKATLRHTNDCPRNCSGHGLCNHGTCYCEHGKWFGGDCSRLRIDCPQGCAQNGFCDHTTGICHCLPGRKGNNCGIQICYPDRQCSGNGMCVPAHGLYGHCECNVGFSGPACNLRRCDDMCSGHGECLDDTCWCKEGYFGDKCEKELCPNKCSGRGSCYATGCKCDPGFAGADCSKQLVLCKNNCSHAGYCVVKADRSAPLGATATCSCNAGYDGPACSPVCALGCSEAQKHGKCTAPNTCTCNEGFTGAQCQQEICPYGCNGRGLCTKAGQCECYTGWGGRACDVKLGCPAGCVHGVCSGTTCVCDKGWRSEKCDQVWCPDRCSYPKGKCSSTGVCECRPGYGMANCSTLVNRALCLQGCQMECALYKSPSPNGNNNNNNNNNNNEVAPGATSTKDCVDHCSLTFCASTRKDVALETQKSVEGQVNHVLSSAVPFPRKVAEKRTDRSEDPYWW